MKRFSSRKDSSLLLFCLAWMTLLSGCFSEESTPLPEPVALDSESMGYYCMMGMSEHKGPKAQIHVEYSEDPIWFSQVRDAVAYLRSPEETARVKAVYVNDMGKAETWDDPGDDNWINADSAQFVINSDRRGGMGIAEAIPFGSIADADAFIADHGGTRVSLTDIPSDYVLSAVQIYLNAQEAKDGKPL